MMRHRPTGFVEMNPHTKMESSETGKVLIRRERVRVGRHMRGLRARVMPLWRFESLRWSISSGFPLVSHLALLESESITGLSPSPMCAHIS